MLYDRPVHDLLIEALDELDEPYTRDALRTWFNAKYPKVQAGTINGNLIAYTANDKNRRHHPSGRRKPPLLFKLSNGSYQRYDVDKHGRFNEFGESASDRDALLGSAPQELDAGVPSDEPMEFALETYLEEFLLSNWTRVDWKRPLEIFRSETDERLGHQFSCDVGRMDFLCRDTSTNSLVVIELKRGRPADQVIGQIARYMGWLRKHKAEEGQTVEGIIVAHAADDKLLYAAAMITGLVVLEYSIDFSLKPSEHL